MRNAEYRCRIGIGLGLQLGSGSGLGSWLGLRLGSGLGFYFAAVLRNFSQFYAFRIVQMQNGQEFLLGTVVKIDCRQLTYSVIERILNRYSFNILHMEGIVGELKRFTYCTFT